ncbi:hypothetical protein JTB14_032462 [Gonioctena quinquepunctata]|nr:hypothetical protein JTB14_032462 [Gonioctena quinquepunctata]
MQDKDNWYGTAAPYIDSFVGNGLRMNELRLGHNTMPIIKEGDKSKVFPVGKYGLNGSHHVLLEGYTFPPEKRGSMVQSLGPMTSFLLHVRKGEKYRRKWTNAATRTMAHIPIIDEIPRARTHQR